MIWAEGKIGRRNNPLDFQPLTDEILTYPRRFIYIYVYISEKVDPEFGEKDLAKWICTTLDQKGVVDHVIDPKLDSCFKEEICRVLNIGLLCTSPLSIKRPSMRRVIKMLQEIGNGTRHKTTGKDGKLTPYYYEDASDHGSVA